jgi:acyl dehydratase
MEKTYFEDCRVGDNVVTPARTLTEADLMLTAAYADVDWFRAEIVVLTMGSALLLRPGDFAFLPKSSIALVEVDKIRFNVQPQIGDTIYLEAHLVSMIKLDKRRGLLVIDAMIKNQHEVTVSSCIAKVLAGRRQAELCAEVGDGMKG